MYGSIRKIIDQETRINEITTAVNNNINSNSDNSSNGLLRAIKHQQNNILIQLSISGKNYINTGSNLINGGKISSVVAQTPLMVMQIASMIKGVQITSMVARTILSLMVQIPSTVVQTIMWW